MWANFGLRSWTEGSGTKLHLRATSRRACLLFTCAINQTSVPVKPNSERVVLMRVDRRRITETGEWHAKLFHFCHYNSLMLYMYNANDGVKC